MTGAERHYVGPASAEYHEKKRRIPQAAVPWVARLRAEKLQSFIKPADTVFEFGAGYGWNLAQLNCHRKLAFDVAKVAGEGSAIEWIEFPEALPDAAADVIICHHVLEHLTSPAETLGLLRRVLKSKGTLLVFVPYEKESRYRRFDASEPNHHLYSWNVQTLGNLVQECGFELASAGLGCFGYDRFAAKLAVRLKCGEIGFRFFRAIAHGIRPCSEVRVVARKP